MIKEQLKIHDKYSFEIKLGYRLNISKRITAYKIDAYLFIPNNLDINRFSYDKEDFYDNLKTYIRFMTPTFRLKDITFGEKSPYQKLKKSLVELTKNGSRKNLRKFEYEIKMFNSIFKSSARDYIAHVEERATEETLDSMLNEYLHSITKNVLKYRELEELFHKNDIPVKGRSFFAFGDENISHLVEFHTYKMLHSLKKIGLETNRKNELLNLIREEINYRKKNKYPSIPDPESNNEELLYRRNVLKKFMENILFLDTHTKRYGKFGEQIVYSLAAGVAMLVATILILKTRETYGDLSYVFLAILVVSYVLKDRIKDILQIYLGGKIKKFSYDYKKSIYAGKDVIGKCKERFGFIKQKNIPGLIKKLRHISHLTEIENEWMLEDVIKYSKQIKIFSKKFKHVHQNHDICGVNDILRINIVEFLNKMANSKKKLYTVDENGYRKIYGQRVYHLNLIVNYEMKEHSFLRRYRIILNKNGIKRIEEVFADHEEGNIK